MRGAPICSTVVGPVTVVEGKVTVPISGRTSSLRTRQVTSRVPTSPFFPISTFTQGSLRKRDPARAIPISVPDTKRVSTSP